VLTDISGSSSGQFADGHNAQPFALQFCDVLHFFSPEQMAALLCFQKRGRLTPPARGWGFFNRHYGDFCTGADKWAV